LSLSLEVTLSNDLPLFEGLFNRVLVFSSAFLSEPTTSSVAFLLDFDFDSTGGGLSLLIDLTRGDFEEGLAERGDFCVLSLFEFVSATNGRASLLFRPTLNFSFAGLAELVDFFNVAFGSNVCGEGVGSGAFIGTVFKILSLWKSAAVSCVFGACLMD